jgi:cytosine/adenosine deaminase-related metal-dependent hydrolase
VGIGTDSEASVGPLDLFAELREARRIGGLAAAATLGLGTLDGALAIGVPDVGGLTPGYWGDVCVIDVAGSPLTGLATDPVELALAASPADVMATWLAGNEVWRRT